MALSPKCKEALKVFCLVFDLLIGVLVIKWYAEEHAPKITPIALDCTVTSYRPVGRQTDSTPNITATNTVALMGQCAVSRDLLSSGLLHYGDIIEVRGLGIYLVNDTMNPRHTNHIDILVYTTRQESLVGYRFHQKVTLIRRHTSDL